MEEGLEELQEGYSFALLIPLALVGQPDIVVEFLLPLVVKYCLWFLCQGGDHTVFLGVAGIGLSHLLEEVEDHFLKLIMTHRIKKLG